MMLDFQNGALPPTNAWAAGFQQIFPEAYVCLETRPTGETKLTSAVVLLDPAAAVATVFVKPGTPATDSLRKRENQ